MEIVCCHEHRRQRTWRTNSVKPNLSCAYLTSHSDYKKKFLRRDRYRIKTNHGNQPMVSHPHRPPRYHTLTDQTMVSHPHRPDHGITPTQTRPWYHTHTDHPGITRLQTRPWYYTHTDQTMVCSLTEPDG